MAACPCTKYSLKTLLRLYFFTEVPVFLIFAPDMSSTIGKPDLYLKKNLLISLQVQKLHLVLSMIQNLQHESIYTTHTRTQTCLEDFQQAMTSYFNVSLRFSAENFSCNNRVLFCVTSVYLCLVTYLILFPFQHQSAAQALVSAIFCIPFFRVSSFFLHEMPGSCACLLHPHDPHHYHVASFQ